MAKPMNASPELLAAIEREAREQGVWLDPNGPAAAAAVGRAIWLLARRSGLTVGIDRRPLHKELLAARGGVAVARDRLAVLGDELQAGGDPLGVLLALWLAGELRAAHVLGVETVPGIPSLRATAHRAEGLARSQLENGAACVDVEQAAGGAWTTTSYWDQPTLEARPTAPGR